MQFITISTLPLEDDSNLSLRRQPSMMRESIARFGIPLVNLGIGAAHEWSFRYRYPIFLDFLRTLDDNEIVLFTDSWDAFFAGTPDEIEIAFVALNCPVVISAECNLWPPDNADRMVRPPAPTRWKYACGGGWIGRAGALREMFSASDWWPSWACVDQAAFDDWICRHQDTAVLDYFCRIFVCGYDDGKADPPIWSVLKATNGAVYNSDTLSCPLVVHGGGGYCTETLALWKTIKEQRGW